MMLYFILIVLVVAGLLLVKFNSSEKKTERGTPIEKEFKPLVITPLADFQWDKEEPIKYRPMKKTGYNMTMGIKRLPLEEQFVIDRNYLNIINVRSKIVNTRGDDFIFYQPEGVEAVREYYDHCILFMTKRYPSCFVEEDGKILNKMKNETLPIRSAEFGQDIRKLLFTLAKNIEDDVVILLKGKDEYVLRAGIFLLPSGFDPKKLIGKQLSLIHGPVPQYESKLKLAMNKFFARVQPYQFVYRNNWSIQTHERLNDIGSNHGKPGEVPCKLKLSELDFNKVFLRSERQVLTRLPQSQLVVMNIKTYFTPMIKLREEQDSRELLCSSIEGLSDDLAVYKNKLKWDELILDYLRLKSNGVTTDFKEYIFED